MSVRQDDTVSLPLSYTDCVCSLTSPKGKFWTLIFWSTSTQAVLNHLEPQLDSTRFRTFSVTAEYRVHHLMLGCYSNVVSWLHCTSHKHHSNGERQGDGIPAARCIAFCHSGTTVVFLCSHFICCSVSKVAVLIFVKACSHDSLSYATD